MPAARVRRASVSPERLSRCRAAIGRGTRWLASQQAEIVKLKDLASHYKALYLYTVTGDIERARWYVDLIGRRYQRADGDFRTTPTEKGWYYVPASPANRYIYTNGWIIVALQKIGAYREAQRGLQFIRRFQSPALGGFYSRFDPKTGTVDKACLDSSSTSSSALALMACGQMAEARRAGEFLLRLIEAQPEPNRYYFSTWRAGRGLITDVFGEEDPNSIHGRKHFCLSAEADAGKELTWLVGKPMKVLGRLYAITGERRYLDGARKLLKFFHRLDENRWRNYSSCKVLWACSELYRSTGDREFLDPALKILDWFCESQLPWGGWVHWVWYKSEAEQPLPAALDLVQELCGEMADVLYDLSGEPAKGGGKGAKIR